MHTRDHDDKGFSRSFSKVHQMCAIDDLIAFRQFFFSNELLISLKGGASHQLPANSGKRTINVKNGVHVRTLIVWG